MIDWRDEAGNERQWESADRIGEVSAVLIIAWLRPSDRLLLVRQYRPPAGRYVYEFPAGLIDEGESPERAALRELKEETGYTATIKRVFPAAYNSPGLSGESVAVVLADIDEGDPANNPPTRAMDEGEQIEVVIVSRADLQALDARAGEEEAALDSKLVAYLSAINLGR